MSGPPELPDDKLPSLVKHRWKQCKTAIYNLSTGYPKYELIKELLRLREIHTVAPNLTEITSFTGFDNAIHSIMRWEWDEDKDTSNLSVDVAEIGKLGAELMILHTLKESIRNNLLVWRDDSLRETKFGREHFSNLNSFNVEITGSRIDIAKKRFQQERMSKTNRKLDPSYKLSSVRKLYWENSVLMLLRTPLTFYRTMQLLSEEQHGQLIEFHSKLIQKTNLKDEGLIKIRLTVNSKADRLMQVLMPPENKEDRRPKFTAALIVGTDPENKKVEYYVAVGALSMFIMFILGFNKDNLDEKSKRAEIAVREIIESTGYWKVLDSNTDVTLEKGEVITEIDIIAQANNDPKKIVTFEVKDFARWRGWIWNEGADNRYRSYEIAVEKLPVKEEFIKKKYNCDEIESYIITSVPESYKVINNMRLVYLADLPELLMKLSNKDSNKRQEHKGSNYLIRYFERLQVDYFNANKLTDPIRSRLKENDKLRMKLAAFKEDYDKLRSIYRVLNSEFDTAKVSSKLAAKRLVKDTGEKHYQLEEDFNKCKVEMDKIKREMSIKSKALKDIKVRYNETLEVIKINDSEIGRLNISKNRLLAGRLF